MPNNLIATNSGGKVVVSNSSPIAAVFNAGYPTISTAPPTISGTPSAATYGTAYSWQPTSSGAGITFSISAGSLPTGLSIDPATGTISGTPTSAYQGQTFNFTIKAHNSGGDAFLVTSIAVATYFSQVAAMSGVISLWTLADTAGSTAVDIKNSFNATYNLMAGLSDLNGPGASMGKAAKFDGLSSFVQLPSASLNTSFDASNGTFAAWLYYNAPWSVGGSDVPMSVGVDTNNRYGGYKSAANTFNGVSVRGGTAALPPATISAVGWHHVAVTWNASSNRFRLYVDGAKQGSDSALAGTWSGGSLSDTYSVLGKFLSSNFWIGWIMGVLLANREFTSSEITTLATAF